MSSPFAADFPHVWRTGCKTVFGNAGIALMSSFTALGALMGDAGFSLAQAVLFSLFGFALPGQLVAAELYAHGAGIAAISITVFLVNARLFPMTVALLPLLVADDDEKPRPVRDLLISHLVAVTSWVCFQTTYQQMAASHRRCYFVVVGGLLWLAASIATIIGFYVGTRLPPDLLIGLLFLNPAYFLCLMLASLAKRSSLAAFAGGALFLPFIHPLSPEWDIVICGVIGGVLSFYGMEHARR